MNRRWSIKRIGLYCVSWDHLVVYVLTFRYSLPLSFCQFLLSFYSVNLATLINRVVSLSSQPSDRYSSETGTNLYVLAGHENTFWSNSSTLNLLLWEELTLSNLTAGLRIEWPLILDHFRCVVYTYLQGDHLPRRKPPVDIDLKLRFSTGWQFCLFKTYRWHWFESCVLVSGPYIKTQLSNQCQREDLNKQNCHPV